MAANTYEGFLLNSYPDDENAAYALGRLAECYEKESPSLDLDQAITVKAVERFTFLKNRYPASPYAKNAEDHIKRLTLKLGAREFYVGEFYYEAGRYNASILRLEYFLRAYPDGADRDKALHYLAEDYGELNRPDKAQEYRDRLKKEYPKSIYARSTAKERKSVSTLAAVSAAGGSPARTVVPVPTVSQPASGVPALEKKEAPAPVFSYEERKKREIDLRPPEPVSPPKDAKGETEDTKATPDNAGDKSGKRAVSSPDTVASGAHAEGAAAGKTAPKAEPAEKEMKAEAETKDGDTKDVEARREKGRPWFFHQKTAR